MNKYFGTFKDRESCAKEWQYYGNEIPADFPSERQILFASYGQGAYEGDAIVLFVKGGKLFEVHGSHCSCMGLEGQWKPEETSWKALAMRPRNDYPANYDHGQEAVAAFWELVDRRLKRAKA